MSLALDDLKEKTGGVRLTLVGFSGGGAVALLLAARRDDVRQVITIAGNVDHAFWTRLHKVSPLRDSLNPADFAPGLQQVPQVHIVSNDDTVIPPSVVRSYLDKMSDTAHARVITVDGIGHTGDWPSIYPGILKNNGVWQ